MRRSTRSTKAARARAVSPIGFGREICGDLTAAEQREWLVTNGLGGFACYALIENYDVSVRERALPMGVSEGCKVIRDVPRDQLVTYEDVELPADRLCDKLRQEQQDHFS